MTAGGQQERGQGFTAFSWQGIRLRVPSGWELVSIRGGWKAGYISLADQFAVRLEMKWQKPPAPVEPHEVASAYIQQLRNQAKRARTPITVHRDLNLASLKGKQTECYEWSCASSGVGMVSRCEACGRVVHVILPAEPGRSQRGIARRVFSSLVDHWADGWLPWRFYGMGFASPESLPLVRHELKTGCIRMLFGRRRRQLEFVRVSMAEAVLRGKPLREWLAGFHTQKLKPWRLCSSEGPVHGHPGLRLDGSAKLLSNPGRLLGLPRQMHLACWHCEASNRILIVDHSAPRGEGEVFEKALESLECCNG